MAAGIPVGPAYSGIISLSGNFSLFQTPSSIIFTAINNAGVLAGIDTTETSAAPFGQPILYSNGIETGLPGGAGIPAPCTAVQNETTRGGWSPSAINDAGQAVGIVPSFECASIGVVASVSGGIQVLSYPGAADLPNGRGVATTVPAGINDKGDIVGNVGNSGAPPSFCETGCNDEPEPGSVGFLYSDGQFSTFIDPEGVGTALVSITDSGEIFGNFVDASGIYHGFSELDGVFQEIDFPGAVSGTFITGVSSNGRFIVGDSFATNDEEGFLATREAPEPPSGWIMLMGLVGFAMWRLAPRKERAFA